MSSHQRAVETTEAPAMLVGSDLRVTFANGSAHALLAYPEGHLAGVPLSSLFEPRRQAELRNFEQLLEGGGARRWRSVLQSFRGERRTVAIALSGCLDSLGRIEAIRVQFEDARGLPNSTPPHSSGVHAAVSTPPSESPGGPSARASASAATTPAPAGSLPFEALRTTLDEARRRLFELEQPLLPTDEPLPPEEWAELRREAREARTLLDEALLLLGRRG